MPNTILKTVEDIVSDAVVTQLTLTTDTNENVIVTGIPAKKIYILALTWCDASATNVTLKAGTNVIASLEMTTNQGTIGRLFPLFGANGESISLQTSSVGTMTVHYTTDQRIAYGLRIV